MIYAYGATDPADSSAPTEYHGRTSRASKSVYLLTEPTKSSPPPEDALVFDMRVSNVSRLLNNKTVFVI